jgi:effector-binding domain-containing protein
MLRLALVIGAAAILTFSGPLSSWAQTPEQQPAAPAAPAKPEAAPASPTANPEASDPFGEDINLTAKPIVFIKGSGTWDNAFETMSNSFKKLRAYVDKKGLKEDGPLMTIFTATDDTGFDFEAAIPISDAPKSVAGGDIHVGTSPEGHALKFVHRGSYDSLDDTYEAITNYLDEKRLEAKDMFVEQYVTDPLTTNQDHLVVNVYVLTK